MKKYLLIAISMFVVIASFAIFQLIKSNGAEKEITENKQVEKNLPEITDDVKFDAKVLFVLTSVDKLGDSDKKTGIWLSELTHPYYEFINNKFDVEIVSIKGGKAPIDNASFDMTDEENKKFIEENKALLDATKSIEAVNAKDYKIIYFVGGHGTMWDFPDNLKVQEITKNIYENEGYVAAVCHGPSALVNVKLSDGTYLIDNKRMAAFSNSEEKTLKLDNIVPFSLEDKIIDRGAEYSRGEDWSEYVVEDRRLITGQNPASAKKIATIIIEKITGEANEK